MMMMTVAVCFNDDDDGDDDQDDDEGDDEDGDGDDRRSVLDPLLWVWPMSSWLVR